MLRRRTALAIPVVVSVLAGIAANASGSGLNERTFGAPAGGFAAYHGTREAADPKKAPANHAIHNPGPKLVLAQSYVGRKAAEPTLGVGQTGVVYTVASDFD